MRKEERENENTRKRTLEIVANMVHLIIIGHFRLLNNTFLVLLYAYLVDFSLTHSLTHRQRAGRVLELVTRGRVVHDEGKYSARLFSHRR
jgi:hypothetical protein